MLTKTMLLSFIGVLTLAGTFVTAEGAESKAAPVFKMQDLFESVRIPNIVVATDGTVLAFARSGRLLRRSTDGGKTWEPIQEIGPDASGSAIVDASTGDVMAVDPRHGRRWRSSDQGKTWAKEAIVVKPNAAGHGTPDGIPVQTTCSESGVTLRRGSHQGRLLMPARIQPPKGNNDQEWWPYNYNTAIYSDDGGKTWQTSGPVKGRWRNWPMATSTTTPAVTWRSTTAGASPGATTAGTCGRTGKSPQTFSKWANPSTSSTAPNPATDATPD